MNVSKARPAGLGVLLAVGIAAGGCGIAGGAEDAAAPASARPLAPRDALLQGLPDASTGGFAFTIKGGEAPTAGEIDPARVDDDEVPVAYDNETDPGEAGAVLRAIVDVRQTGAGRFAGTTDLTQQGDADIVDATRLKALGTRAKAVPFEATLDDRGRLTSTVVRIPAAGRAAATRYEITYAGYGSTATPAAPAADEQQPATRDAYELLNA